MRANSLTNLGVALDYNVTSDYDKVLVLADIASEIEELAPHANEIASIVANLPDVLTVQEATDIINNLTVSVTPLPAGSIATSELVGTEIRLRIPAGAQGVQGIQGPKGDKGDRGDIGLTGAQGPVGATGPQGPRGFRGEDGLDGEGVVITSILNNLDKSITINFSDGTQHTTDPLKGEDGKSVTITNVINNVDGSLTIGFSDGTSHTTGDLRGPRGFKGDTGDNVHHVSYTRSKDPLGNEVGPITPGSPGYNDIYSMWSGQEELPEQYIGEFSVYNGLNGLPSAEQAKLDSIEWGATADQVASEVPFNNVDTELSSVNVQSALVELSTEKENKANKGLANGYAGLDSNGKVVLTQIPDSVLGQLEYQGVWNFTTLPTATQKGQYWIASVSGNGYVVGDWAVWNGTAFDKVDNTDAVASVAGRTGNVVLTKSDVGLSLVDNTADSTKNVLSATKLTTSRNIALTGDVTGNINFDGSANVSIATTIAANSVALGTDTTGNYVAGATAGAGISISGTAGEGWSPTIALTNVGAAGTYRSVTTDAYGRVTAGTNPTTVAGYGLTDVYTKTQVDTNIGTVAEFNAAINF